MSRKFVPVSEPLHTTGICLFPLRLPISGGHAGVYGGGFPKLSIIDRMDDRYCSRKQTLAPVGKRFVSIPYPLTHWGRNRPKLGGWTRKRRRNRRSDVIRPPGGMNAPLGNSGPAVDHGPRPSDSPAAARIARAHTLGASIVEGMVISITGPRFGKHGPLATPPQALR